MKSKELSQVFKDYAFLCFILVAVFLAGFIPGYFIGRSRAPVVEYTVVPKAAPTRTFYYEMNVAGGDEKQVVRVEEYLTQGEFVERRSR